MINKRLNFIRNIGMSDNDSFDISKISDKLKRRKISEEDDIITYEIVPENGNICTVGKDDTGAIISYKSDGGSHASIYNNSDYHIVKGDIEEVYTTVNETYKVYTKKIKGILVDRYDEYVKDTHCVQVRDKEYTILYNYEMDNIKYYVSIITSKDIYESYDMSDIKNVKLYGIWDIKTYYSDDRPSIEYNSRLYYKKYYYNETDIPIGSIEIDTMKDIITEISTSHNGTVVINRSITTGEGTLINEHGDISHIRIDPRKQRGILFNNTILNIMNIDINDEVLNISSGDLSYESIVSDTSVINKYSDGTESKYMRLNGVDQLLYKSTPFTNSVVVYTDNSMNEYITSSVSTINMGYIKDNHDTTLAINNLPYGDYTSREILNDGSMIVYRLHGIISQINVISKKGNNNILKENFIFAFDGSMKSIEQYYYNRDMLSMINII